MSSWVIALSKVEQTPKRFELEGDAAWWDDARAHLREPEARVREAARLEFDGHRLGRRLLFRGKLRAAIDLVCSRCLDGYTERFDEPFQLLLEPLPDRGEVPEGGIELDPDDAEIGRYGGEQLDFGAAVLEMLALAWPMQPVCKETCRGLCASCGTNRNLEACSCEDASITRPFADLRGLLERARRRDE